ncbi:LysR family transcriptional regulator [Pseudoalteromonas sp. DL2-H2.2]|uniref:LysR family transcriptional regulator n=1 Tax=Pseudoalteromonas sp. DL2-H2.2 TaxID=2908889 RepID=UPI001F2A09CC|nr:LysR family transcriptional regulator [Pseudoalteromonas sp. DL2-H2.2]MCF2908108.1 LysR family transcriptional regulator [Pseudoalteromonas sp. DL2-H2.2]
MDIEQIRLFISVYRARSFAAVAKELNIAPSSVSRAIASLEEKLQTRLFQRTTRRLAPTQSGEHYYQRVEILIEELELAEQEILTQNSEPFGTLRVTASTSFGQTVLAPLMKGFHAQYPKIRVELTLSDSQSNIIDEQFDLAIRHGNLSDSSFIARKLIDVRYLLVASKEYLEASCSIQAPQDIQKHRLISFSYNSFNKEWNFRRDQNTETVSISPMLTITSASAIKECIKSGFGISLLPDWIIREELKNKKLVSILDDWHISGKNFNNAIWLIYPTRTFIPAKTNAFMAYLQTKVS